MRLLWTDHVSLFFLRLPSQVHVRLAGRTTAPVPGRRRPCCSVPGWPALLGRNRSSIRTREAVPDSERRTQTLWDWRERGRDGEISTSRGPVTEQYSTAPYSTEPQVPWQHCSPGNSWDNPWILYPWQPWNSFSVALISNTLFPWKPSRRPLITVSLGNHGTVSQCSIQ